MSQRIQQNSSWFNLKSIAPSALGFYASGIVYQNPTPIINYSAATIGAKIGLSSTASKWMIGPWIAKPVTMSVLPKVAAGVGIGTSCFTLGVIKTVQYINHRFKNNQFQNGLKGAEKLGIPMQDFKPNPDGWIVYG